ncbi:UNVERIFIED_CONTAM: Zinc finger protein ZAT9 [Sesamum radiatum]|uniref:Zinc finger protein ZAT9 n=1 Tax=Sesamum radiatum TaxID=300843 RepID=A0AAW2JRV5_SESRA
MDSHSDTEAEDRILRTRSSKSNKRYKKIVVKSPSFSLANNGSSSVSEIDGEEQEEVAMCLMLLSRDSGNKGGVNSVVESSDNNSVILETKSSSIDMRTKRREAPKEVDEIPQMKKIGDMMKLKDSVLEVAQVENSDSGYFLDECAKAESDVSVDGFRRNGAFGEYSKPLMNGSYEEYGAEFRHSLNRSKNYRAELKRELSKENDYDTASNSARIESRRRSLDDSTEFVTTGKLVESASNRRSSAKELIHYVEKKIKAKKNKGHVCPFCNRVFKNGQALGGHKRSHFIGGHEENNHRSPVAKPDMLDLNLPAPEEDEDDGRERFSPW